MARETSRCRHHRHSFLSAAILLAGEIKNLLPEPEPGRKGAPKQFEKYLERAETSLADGDKDGAKADFMNALKVKKAELSDAAEAMHGLARLLKEEGRFDAASRSLISRPASTPTNRTTCTPTPKF